MTFGHVGTKDAFKILLFPETHVYEAESKQIKVRTICFYVADKINYSYLKLSSRLC